MLMGHTKRRLALHNKRTLLLSTIYQVPWYLYIACILLVCYGATRSIDLRTYAYTATRVYDTVRTVHVYILIVPIINKAY